MVNSHCFFISRIICLVLLWMSVLAFSADTISANKISRIAVVKTISASDVAELTILLFMIAPSLYGIHAVTTNILTHRKQKTQIYLGIQIQPYSFAFHFFFQRKPNFLWPIMISFGIATPGLLIMSCLHGHLDVQSIIFAITPLREFQID